MFLSKHYNELALWFQEAGQRKAKLPGVIEIVCDGLAADNPNFNRDRFIAACVPGAPIQEDAFAKRARELRALSAAKARKAAAGAS